MVSVFSIIFVLGGLIFFHELGHFFAARALGIGVQKFSLGFGPRLYGIRRGQTDYQLALIPLGGFVLLLGESDTADTPEDVDRKKIFSLRPAWQRMLVIAAGPICNLVLAWLIYWGLFWAQGQMHLQPEIGSVQENSPAQRAGLQQGDRLVRIGDHEITYWNEISEAINSGDGSTVTIAVNRRPTPEANPVLLELQLTPMEHIRKTLFGEDERTLLIGIYAANTPVHQPMNLMTAFTAGTSHTWDMVVLIGQGFVKLFQRIVPLDTIGGPIMIAQMVTEQAEEGLVPLLGLAALISINLGLLNLLPIPILDGGHLLFLSLETVFRRPIPKYLQTTTTYIGLGLLLLLMLLATYNDIIRVFFTD